MTEIAHAVAWFASGVGSALVALGIREYWEQMRWFADAYLQSRDV